MEEKKNKSNFFNRLITNSGLSEDSPKILRALQGTFVVIAIFTILFHIYVAITTVVTETMLRSAHIGLLTSIAYLIDPIKRYKKTKKFSILYTLISILFAVISIIVNGYIFLNDQELIFYLGAPTDFQILLGIVDIILVLEACRRYTGLALPIIAIVMLLYTYFGDLMPAIIKHKGYGFDRIISTMYISQDGIFGSTTAVSSSYVMLFVIFGSALQASGAGKVFIDTVTGLFGKYRGGPAKMAVVSSALFGTISGSSVANVVSTGSFTIPLMISRGYSKKFAGAVEAVASTGGQIMPPIMGAVAFLIAEFLGMQYSEIVVIAFAPAILYYLGLYFMVDFEAARLKMPTLSKEELPDVKKVLSEGGHLLIPMLILLFIMLFLGMTPSIAAIYSIAAMLAVAMFKRSTRWTPEKLIDICVDSCNSMIQIALACATAGIVVGSLGLTGLGLRFSGVLITLAGGNLIVLLLLCMVACIILGMGLPSVGVYVILAVLVAPALIDMGVLPIAAHMFIFYFGNLAAITPPVAMASFAAAAIAKEDAMKVGFTACRIGLVAFILPFAFIYQPELLLQGSPVGIVYALVTAIISTYVLAVSLEEYKLKGKFKRIYQLLLFISSIMLMGSHLILNIISMVIIVVILFLNRTKKVNQNEINA